MWIDPSYTAASYQNSTGTTPLSAIGTVADSSNPVGLILDRKAGLVLGAELAPPLETGSGYAGLGWVISGGEAEYGGIGDNLVSPIVAVAGTAYEITYTQTSAQTVYVRVAGQGPSGISGMGPHTIIFTAPAAGEIYLAQGGWSVGEAFTSFSVREIPGLHLSQATSTARPLASAKGGQTVAGDGTYSASGYPIYQIYDGVDDGLSTATFAAGTLTSSMDCLIAVRRDSAASAVCGLYNAVADATKFFGMVESGSGSGCVGSGAGTPTVWVDGVQLTGGTAVTRGTLHTALTTGSWHVLEFRGLDLSAWTAAGLGLYTGYVLNGGHGGIRLCPALSDANRNAALTELAAKVGLTL